MPRRLLTPTAGSALALVGVLALAGMATQAILRGGNSHATGSGTQVRAAFRISGNLVRPLTPGTWQRLHLRLSNRSRHNLLVTKLTVSLRVDAAHRLAGCSRRHSFRVVRLQHREYPISLPARRTRSLRALGVRHLPRVRMLNLPTNQDACKGATLRLSYGGGARRRHPVHAP